MQNGGSISGGAFAALAGAANEGGAAITGSPARVPLGEQDLNSAAAAASRTAFSMGSKSQPQQQQQMMKTPRRGMQTPRRKDSEGAHSAARHGASSVGGSARRATGGKGIRAAVSWQDSLRGGSTPGPDTPSANPGFAGPAGFGLSGKTPVRTPAVAGTPMTLCTGGTGGGAGEQWSAGSSMDVTGCKSARPAGMGFSSPSGFGLGTSGRSSGRASSVRPMSLQERLASAKSPAAAAAKPAFGGSRHGSRDTDASESAAAADMPPPPPVGTHGGTSKGISPPKGGFSIGQREQKPSGRGKAKEHAGTRRGSSSAAAAAKPQAAPAAAAQGFTFDAREHAAAAAAAPLPPQAAAPSFCTDRAQELAHEAQALATVGRVTDALECLTRAIRVAPADWPYAATLYSGRGAGLIEQGRYEAAIVDLTEALRRDPRDARGFALLGRAHLLLGQFLDAETAYQQALTLAVGAAATDDGSSSAAVAEARAACSAGLDGAFRLRQHLAAADRAQAISPAHVLDAADAALAIAPRSAAAGVLRARALCALRRWRECVLSCELVCAAPPAAGGGGGGAPGAGPCTPWPEEGEGGAPLPPYAAALSMPEEAAKPYIRALRGAGRGAEARTAAAALLARAPAAAAWAREAVRAYDAADAAAAAAHAALAAGDWQTAADSAAAAVAADPDNDAANARLHCVSAAALLALRRAAAAAERCNAALALDAALREPLLLRARATEALGHHYDAVHAYRVYLGHCPGDAAAAAELRALEARIERAAAAAMCSGGGGATSRGGAAPGSGSSAQGGAPAGGFAFPGRKAAAGAAPARGAGGGGRATAQEQQQQQQPQQRASAKNASAGGGGSGSRAGKAGGAGMSYAVDTTDLYAVLGVTRSAERTAIRAAYRSLALLYHPDKNPDPRAAEVFKKVGEAYKTLTSPASKQAYDQKLGGPGGRGSGSAAPRYSYQR
ncbi:hypothetical protein JKP88DRAFT_300421 [Tribonema minus]|uniref:J domain-containing protein n=1 Tax=Tribonema minus TaxID=303371 RepID=A0A836CNJ2_9STRA|nr:hypothetical protein JKP88DRAFT_300421 [Tribonema minus]